MKKKIYYGIALILWSIILSATSEDKILNAFSVVIMILIFILFENTKEGN